VHRADEDHAALTGLERGQRDLRQQQGRGDIALQHLHERGFVLLQQAAVVRDAGVVDEAVQPAAPVGDRGVDHRLAGLRLRRDIADHDAGRPGRWHPPLHAGGSRAGR
jgi:hypothetical protein